jgi:hypothetical protein
VKTYRVFGIGFGGAGHLCVREGNLRHLPGFPGVSRLLLAVVLVVAAFAVRGPALAQVADGVFEVEVVDETGVALPGVSIELERPETGFSSTNIVPELKVRRRTWEPE